MWALEPRHNCLKLSSTPSSRALRLLQDGDLPGMIKLVLHRPVQQVIKVISLPRNLVAQSFVAQSGNGLDQFFMRALRLCDG